MFDRSFDINVKGPYFLLQALLPVFANPASVVLTTSVSAHAGSDRSSVYAATKAAFLNMLRLCAVARTCVLGSHLGGLHAIEARASMKSLKAKDGSSKPPEDGGRNPTVDFKGEERKNDTHASTTDPEARLLKKSKGDKSRLCYLGIAPMENRNGLVVDVETTLPTGTADREAAEEMVERSLKPQVTVGADKNCDTAGFVKARRQSKVTPHVAQKTDCAIDGRTTRHAGYAVSLKIRRRIEEIFGWAKTFGGLRKTRFIGLAKVKAQTTLTLAAYNLTWMATEYRIGRNPPTGLQMATSPPSEHPKSAENQLRGHSRRFNCSIRYCRRSIAEGIREKSTAC